ncbi:MAG: hypothetical protein RI935_777, partial [Candidatus Parcubacteria bacterium]
MNNSGYILGIHYAHDATVALMKNGEVIEAMSEERLSRAKKHSGFPHEALTYIKNKYGNIPFDKIVLVGENAAHDGVVFTTKEQNLEGRKSVKQGDYFLRALGVRFPPFGLILFLRDLYLIKRDRFGVKKKVDKYIEEIFGKDQVSKIERIEHHHAHAWCAPLFVDDLTKKRIVLTLDGVGDGISGSVNVFDGKKIERMSSVSVDASIGMLYCGIVDILGMSRNEHEFKVMGLAPYAKATSGEKVYEKLKKLVWFDEE